MGLILPFMPASTSPADAPDPYAFTRRRLCHEWPAELQALHHAALGAHDAAETLEALCRAAGWRDEGLNQAYHAAYDAYDCTALRAALILAAWERQREGPDNAITRELTQ